MAGLPRPGVDQRADVGVACGDHAVERRGHALERGQLLQAIHLRLRHAHVGARDVDRSRAPRISQPVLVALLSAGPALPHQLRGAAARHFGEVHIRLRLRHGRLILRQLRLRLAQLLVEFRRLNLSQHVTAFHVGADVVIPAFHVAAGARIDRRVDERHRLARQHQRLVGRAADRMHDLDERRRRLGSLGVQRRLGHPALAHPVVNQAAKQRGRNRQTDQQHPAGPRGSRRRLVGRRPGEIVRARVLQHAMAKLLTRRRLGRHDPLPAEARAARAAGRRRPERTPASRLLQA